MDMRRCQCKKGIARSAAIAFAIFALASFLGCPSPASPLYDQTTPPGAALVSWGPHLYVLGGVDAAGNYRAEVWHTTIGSDGLPGAWNREIDLPEAFAFASCVTFGQLVYIIGGRDAGGHRGKIYFTLIYTDGSLGFTSGWATSTRSLPTATACATPLIVGGRLFLSGGKIGQKVDAPVMNAGFWSDGQLGQWYEAPAILPVSLSASTDICSTSTKGMTSISLANSVFSIAEIRGSQAPRLEILRLEDKITDPPRVSPGDGNVRMNSKVKIVAFPGDTVRYTVSAYGTKPADPTGADTDTLWAQSPTALPVITTDNSYAFRAFRPGSEPSEIVYANFRPMSASMFVLLQSTVFPQAASTGLSTYTLTETYSDGTSLAVSSVWLRLLVSERSPLSFDWQDAVGDATAWSASVRVSLYEDASASRPALIADGPEFYRLSAEEGAPVAAVLGSGTYFLKIESTDGSTGGTFGLVVREGG